jgi:hypothetical protein
MDVGLGVPYLRMTLASPITALETPVIIMSNENQWIKSYRIPIFPLNAPCKHLKMTSPGNSVVMPNPNMTSDNPSGPNNSTGRRPTLSDAMPQKITVTASPRKKVDS